MHNKWLRRFLKLLLFLVCLAGLGAAFWQLAPSYAKAPVLQALRWGQEKAIHYDLISGSEVTNIRQVMTADPSTSRTIMWQSSFAQENPVVEYRVKGQNDSQTVSAAEEKFTDGGKETYITCSRVPVC